MENLNSYGLKIPEILLPAEKTDLKAWAVIACDQHTQDREYWKRCEAAAEGKPSTLHHFAGSISGRRGQAGKNSEYSRRNEKIY